MMRKIFERADIRYKIQDTRSKGSSAATVMLS